MGRPTRSQPLPHERLALGDLLEGGVQPQEPRGSRALGPRGGWSRNTRASNCSGPILTQLRPSGMSIRFGARRWAGRGWLTCQTRRLPLNWGAYRRRSSSYTGNPKDAQHLSLEPCVQTRMSRTWALSRRKASKRPQLAPGPQAGPRPGCRHHPLGPSTSSRLEGGEGAVGPGEEHDRHAAVGGVLRVGAHALRPNLDACGPRRGPGASLTADGK